MLEEEEEVSTLRRMTEQQTAECETSSRNIPRFFDIVA